MLDDRTLFALISPILSIVREIETELILNIAEQLKLGKLTKTSEYQLERLATLGLLNADNIEVIAKHSGLLVEEVLKALENAGIKSIDMDSLIRVYDKGLTTVDPMSLDFQAILATHQDTIQNEMRLLMTSAVTHSAREYQNILDKASLEVSLGVRSYDDSIRRSLKELSQKGITATQYQGINKNGEPYVINYGLEASVRRSVMTSINQVANGYNEMVIDELKPPQIQTSQHLGARNKGKGYENHEKWQGRVFDNDGTFEEETGYLKGDMLGLGGYNCRHTHHAFWEGISPEIERIDDEENSKVYELTQKQRYYERQIKYAKRELMAMEQLEDEEGIENAKKLIRKRQATIRQFINENSKYLRRDYAREQVY